MQLLRGRSVLGVLGSYTNERGTVACRCFHLWELQVLLRCGQARDGGPGGSGKVPFPCDYHLHLWCCEDTRKKHCDSLVKPRHPEMLGSWFVNIFKHQRERMREEMLSQGIRMNPNSKQTVVCTLPAPPFSSPGPLPFHPQGLSYAPGTQDEQQLPEQAILSQDPLYLHMPFSYLFHLIKSTLSLTVPWVPPPPGSFL